MAFVREFCKILGRFDGILFHVFFFGLSMEQIVKFSKSPPYKKLWETLPSSDSLPRSKPTATASCSTPTAYFCW